MRKNDEHRLAAKHLEKIFMQAESHDLVESSQSNVALLETGSSHVTCATPKTIPAMSNSGRCQSSRSEAHNMLFAQN